MALYKKYRPQSFTAFVGNSEVTTALQAALAKSRDERPHAMLITGNSGCGKTTLGRIIASELECHMDHDYRELDTADFRGIEMARDIRSKMDLMPLAGSCKVYLLDECHKLTADAQNALLKALEDTPSHVYFILCTTNPEKLIKTIRSRCTLFKVNPLTESAMNTHLKKIVRRERKKVEDDVIEKISAITESHPRAAMVLLDTIIDLPYEQQVDIIKSAKADHETVLDVYFGLVRDDTSWKVVARHLKKILETEEPERVRRALMTCASNALLRGKVDYNAHEVLQAFKMPTYDSGKSGIIRDCFLAYNMIRQ